ncbi:MAG: mechanosensitive ion channel family protein [Deltaproteobacteria bacterium]|nr:mechanosensitive ion channel family protein [Deltaproteobacteria bacterium]
MLSKFNNIPVDTLLQIGLILAVTFIVLKVSLRFLKIYTEKRRDVLPPTSLFSNLLKLVVLLIGLLMILQALGISIAPILTAMGVGGLAVALGLQPTLTDFFSGLQVLLSRQLRVGDYIQLDNGMAGYVHDITWRNTTVRALANNMIVIPNTKLAASIITNYCKPQREMAVLMQVGVAYDSDLKKVEQVTVETAKEVLKEYAKGVSGFEPFIRYHTFGDSSIHFTVILRAAEFVDQYIIKHEFVKALQARYAKEGINIPFPIRTVYLKGGGEGGTS